MDIHLNGYKEYFLKYGIEHKKTSDNNFEDTTKTKNSVSTQNHLLCV